MAAKRYGSGKHLRAETDKPSGRDIKLQVLHLAFGFHNEEVALPLGSEVYYSGGVFLWHIYHHCFIRLAFLTIDFP